MGKRPIDERFLEKVDKVAGEDGCWLWISSHVGKPPWQYGTFRVDKATVGMVMAHRFSYELLVGPIPKGLQLDHLCRTPLCVNPAHLEPVTARENVLRSSGFPARQASQTHCKYGHPLSGENLAIRADGSRQCIACRRRRQRNEYRKGAAHASE